MSRPDFAHTDLGTLTSGDLRLLIENMPQPGDSYEAIAQVLETLPSTIESMLTSDYIYQLIHDRRQLMLGMSPFLLFSVLLRRSLGRPRTVLDRRVLNYLANLLALFVRTDRVFRVEPGDREPHHYVVELIAEADDADPRRAFVTYAHVGNYALWLTGLQMQWLEQRYHFGRRPISPDYYAGFGQSSFERAARHQLARGFGLDDVFMRLAVMFDHYRGGLATMQRDHLTGS
ncbi:hypothetical protein [Thiohalomonas denitrificans]|uniref:hypothetical protein n=1 Tax=Thiohalomonas denitrificans TaxID=415747 RepID=UPI0026F0DBF5|nr:hypothetical protein [Thiohalomonas denitrificans]